MTVLWFKGSPRGGHGPLLDQLTLQVILGSQADDCLRNRTVLEDENCRNRADFEFARDLAVIVDVHFADLDCVAQFLGQLLEDWSNGFTWAAPGRPEVNDDGNRCVADGGFEARTIKFGDLVRHIEVLFGIDLFKKS